MNFGKAVESTAARAIKRDDLHKNLLEHLGGKGEPDFMGLGGASGSFFEVTMRKAGPEHLKRPYGSTSIPILYDIPPGMTAFP